MSELNIHPHPNKEHPERLRLQIRELDVQRYYSFKAYGSENAAMKAAIEKRDSLLKVHRLRQQLGFRQVFRDDGLIQGIRMHVLTIRNKIVMALLVSENGQREQKIKERFVNPDNISAVFEEFLESLFRIKHIILDASDKAHIKKIRMNYIRAFHQLYDAHVAPIEQQKKLEDDLAKLQPPTLFTDSGKVDGLSIKRVGTRGIIMLNLRACVEGKRVQFKERVINKNNFNTKFHELVDILAAHLGISLSETDQALLIKIRQKYRRDFNKLEKTLAV